MVASAVEPDARWLYRVGGISGIAVGIGYIVIIPVYIAAAYLAVMTAILGIVSVAAGLIVPALGQIVIVASVLATVWVLVVGYRLYRLGQH